MTRVAFAVLHDLVQVVDRRRVALPAEVGPDEVTAADVTRAPGPAAGLRETVVLEAALALPVRQLPVVFLAQVLLARVQELDPPLRGLGTDLARATRGTRLSTDDHIHS